MWKYRLGTARRLSSLTVLLLLTACGGGGGGGDGGPAPVAYSGNTSAATVTPTNASKLTANVVGGNETATVILGVSIENGDAAQDLGGGVMDLGLRLNRNFRDVVVRAQRSSAAQQAARGVIPIDETEPCDGTGSVRTSGTLADNGTGTLSVNFNNCFLDGLTLNGPATLRVDAFDLGFLIPTDFTMSFSRLTLRGVGVSVDTGGSLRAQLNIGTNAETITANLVSLNNNNGETAKTENLVIVSVYDNIFFPTTFTANISGRVFDQIHGYVDVTTDQLLVFGTLSQLFPDSGQIMLTGASNGRIRVTALTVPPAALPATLVMLELDVDGDGGVDNTATLKWTDLSEPAGTDLGDNDSDGMHNSWETANVLEPGLDDAAGDKDGDGASNLIEYQAGTDPSDPSSHP